MSVAPEHEECPCCGFEGRPGARHCDGREPKYCRRCPAGKCGKAAQGLECARMLVDTGKKLYVAPSTHAGKALERFRAARAKTVEGIFDMGSILIEVKGELAHGHWLPWLDAAGIGRTSSERLMRIASDPKLLDYKMANAAHAPHLPCSRETLYQLTTLTEGEFHALAEEGKIHPEMTRADLKRSLSVSRNGAPPSLPSPPEGRYRVILADPPWRFETRGEGSKAAAERHYPTMALADVELLPVMDLAADDAALFLWVTSERLADAPRIMVQWGFELVSTAFVWVKEGQPGLGYWTRKGSELCLLGTRGSPRRAAADVAEVVHAPRTRHSEKPAEVYTRIERLVSGPYLELFARGRRAGWDAWGNDPALEEATA